MDSRRGMCRREYVVEDIYRSRGNSCVRVVGEEPSLRKRYGCLRVSAVVFRRKKIKNKDMVVWKENSKDRMKGVTINESMRGSWLRHQGNYWDMVQLQETLTKAEVSPSTEAVPGRVRLRPLRCGAPKEAGKQKNKEKERIRGDEKSVYDSHHYILRPRSRRYRPEPRRPTNQVTKPGETMGG